MRFFAVVSAILAVALLFLSFLSPLGDQFSAVLETASLSPFQSSFRFDRDPLSVESEEASLTSSDFLIFIWEGSAFLERRSTNHVRDGTFRT